MDAPAWIALATLLFLILSTIGGIIARVLVHLSREMREQSKTNQERHESNIQRLTRIETKLNIIGNGSIAHLGGPEPNGQRSS